MRKIIVLLFAAVMLNTFTACATEPEHNGVYYISSQSSVDGGRYSLCFENTTAKTLGFCIYGVFDDNKRAAGLDKNGALKKIFIAPYSKVTSDFWFRDIPSRTAPKDVVIIGEYKEKG